MTIKPPPAAVQMPLFAILPDKRLNSPGESRARYGRAAEEIVCALLKLDPIINSGGFDAVFDAFGHGGYCEIKSVRQGSSIPLYQWRSKKDAMCPEPVFYIVLVHLVKDAADVADIYHQMTGTVRHLLVLPSREMSRLAARHPVRQLVKQENGTRTGYKRKGYCSGYRLVPVREILEQMDGHLHTREAVVHGLPVRTGVMFHKDLTPWQ